MKTKVKNKKTFRVPLPPIPSLTKTLTPKPIRLPPHLGKLSSICSLASADPKKYYFSCLHVEQLPDDKYEVAATDGCLLFVAAGPQPISEDVPPVVKNPLTSGLVDGHIWDSTFRGDSLAPVIVSPGSKTIRVSRKQGHHRVLQSIVLAVSKDKFPKYHSVMPTTQPVAKFSLGIDLFAKCLSVLKSCSDSDTVVLEFWDEVSSVRMRVKRGEDECVAVLMPKRTFDGEEKEMP